MNLKPADVITMAAARGLDVQFELGKKHDGAFTHDGVTELIEQGQRWLDAGALQLVVEARESAKEVGLFDDSGILTMNSRIVLQIHLDFRRLYSKLQTNQASLLC